MSVAVSLTGGRKPFKTGRTVRLYFTLVFSGSYVLGGDTVSFAGLVPGSKAPIQGTVDINGVSGFRYEYVNGTNNTNGLVKVRVNDAGGVNAPNAEHTAVAYVAGVTGDVVTGVAEFDLFQG